MANISPKLFQNTIKGLKTTLFTTSTFALMLSSGGAFGAAAARTVEADNAVLSTGFGLDGGGAVVFAPNSTLQYNNVFSVAQANENIRAIDLNNFAVKQLIVTDTINLGSVIDSSKNGKKVAVSINNNEILSLRGYGTADAMDGNGALAFASGANAAARDYSALGDITLNGPAAELEINADGGAVTLPGNIDGVANNNGELTVSTPTNFTGVIGGTKTLNLVTFNNGNAFGGSTAGNISATTVTIGQDANGNASLVKAGAITATTINFANAGTLGVTGAITGNVIFTANGTLNAGNGIDGNVTSVGNNGTLIINAGDVTGAIGTNGGANILQQVKFNGVSEVTTIDATAVIINTKVANVTATGLITAAVNFANAGTLTVNGGINGAVTTAGNGATGGTLIVDGGNLIQDVGTNPNRLTQVIFSNGDILSTAQNIFATNVVIGQNPIAGTASEVTAGAITGNVQFAFDGVLTANAGITGAVTTVNGNGTLTALAGITGAVGQNGASLKVLNAKVDTLANIAFDSDIYAQTVNFDDVAGGGAVGTIQVKGDLIATNVNFSANAAGGILDFNDPTADAEHKFYGAIVNGNNATLNINTAFLTTYDPSIGTVAQINIGAGNGFEIDSSSGDVTILNGQAIDFGDANSSLALSNLTGAGIKNILLANNLAAFAGNGGELFFDGGANGLNIGSSLANNVRNIGDAGGDKFTSLTIDNKVTVTKDINLAGIQTLEINDGGDFTDNGNSSVNIANITIEDGRYTIDASGGNVNVPGGNIKLVNPAAELVLQNSSNADDRTITLGANINPNNVGEGVVILNSVEAGQKLTINGGVALGGANKLKAIVFDGAGDFDTSGLTNLNTVNIGVDTTGNLTLGATTANVIIGNDAAKLTQTGNIGGFLDFFNNNATVTLNAGVNIVGAVQNTGGNSNGTLIAKGASNLASVNGIAMLQVGAGAVTIATGGDVNVTAIQGNGTKLLTLPVNFKLTGAINANGGDALQLSIADGSSFSGVVGTAANPVGDMTLTGTNSFANTINSSGTVTLSKGSVTTFAKDVTATAFVANGAAMEFDSNLALNGNITGAGTTLDLGANQITYTGTATFTDTLTLATIFDVAAKSGGNILIKSGSTLDLSGSNLALDITVINFNINDIDENSQYKVIVAETAGGLKPAPAGNVKVTINNTNRFVGITFDTSTLTLFAEDIAEDVIEEEFTGVTRQSLRLMATAPNGSDAHEALDNWGDLTIDQIIDAVGHVIQNSVKPSEIVAACGQAVSGNIFGNLASIGNRIDRTQAIAAAGDEDLNAQYGGWINPFIGNATQKKIQNISGYKSDTTGGTLGFDALINDDAVLGLAYTRAETDVKLKDAKQGDKNKVRSNIFSLYGLYNLPQSNFFVEGVASYGDSKVTSKSRRIIAVAPETIGYQNATGKYKSENYTGQLMAGYTYALPETVSSMPLVVTPTAGIRYSDIKDKGYKETGTTYQNLIVKGKSYNTFDGLAGAKLSSSINVSEVVLTPEVYAMVDYAFKNKAPAIDARLQGMAAPFPTNSFKPKKTSFDLGAGLTIKHNMVEYGVNYDANIGNKYFAQQGSVKLRVNF